MSAYSGAYLTKVEGWLRGMEQKLPSIGCARCHPRILSQSVLGRMTQMDQHAQLVRVMFREKLAGRREDVIQHLPPGLRMLWIGSDENAVQ